MPTPPITLRRTMLAALVGLGAVGCDRTEPGSSDQTSSGASGAGAATVSAVTDSGGAGWEADAGAVLVLAGDEGTSTGSLVRVGATDQTLADTTGLGEAVGDSPLDLFSRGGRLGGAQLRIEGAPRTDAGCTAWPVARLSPDPGSSATPWTVGFLAGRIEAIPLDSIEALPPRDSATLAAQIARAASRLPDDTNPTFRARPYVVQRAWITRNEPGLVVALLIRRVNQEDAPLEERLVMVLDGGDSQRADPWRVGWHERASGTEEELIVAEPLLAYRLRDAAPAAADPHLLFGRDDGYALSATVLVRRAGQWRVLWESAIAGCG